MVLLSSVDISRVIGDDNPTGKPKQRRAYAPRKKSDNNALLIPLQIAVDFVFGLPVYLGWGEHWQLEEDENKDLCVCIRDVLDAFPSRSSKAFLRALEKWMPIISLAITAWTIAKPRIAKTRALLAEKLELHEIEQAEKDGASSAIS